MCIAPKSRNVLCERKRGPTTTILFLEYKQAQLVQKTHSKFSLLLYNLHSF